MLLTRHLLAWHARRAYGPLARIERDGTWLDVVDGTGRPTVSFPGTNGKAEERALEFLRGMPRYEPVSATVAGWAADRLGIRLGAGH